MPEEVNIGQSIIIPSSISSAALPRTSILNADLDNLREKKFLLELELGIQPHANLTRKEIDQITKSIPNEKSEALVNYIRLKIIFNQFEQAESWTHACLECSTLKNKRDFNIVLAEVNYHQGYFNQTEFYLSKTAEVPQSHPLFLVREYLAQDLKRLFPATNIETEKPANFSLDKLKDLINPPFIPMLKKAIELAYDCFRKKNYLTACQALDPFDQYYQKLRLDISPDARILQACLSQTMVASRIELFIQHGMKDYPEIYSLLAPLRPFNFDTDLRRQLFPASDQIRNPLFRIIKENASNFVDCCNSMGVALFQVGQTSGDVRFLQSAKDVFKIQAQLTNILYPNMGLGHEAKMHVLTNLNSSDIAIARDELGSAFQSLTTVVRAINCSDETFPVSLAAASSLRIGTMKHTIYSHLRECVMFVELSKSHREQFPEYLKDQHPQFLDIWKYRFDGIRPLTTDNVIDLNLRASEYQSESAYCYQQFAAFPKEVKKVMLEQSNWSHQNLIDNMLALSVGRPPKQHLFLPLELELAS